MWKWIGFTLVTWTMVMTLMFIIGAIIFVAQEINKIAAPWNAVVGLAVISGIVAVVVSIIYWIANSIEL